MKKLYLHNVSIHINFHQIGSLMNVPERKKLKIINYVKTEKLSFRCRRTVVNNCFIKHSGIYNTSWMVACYWRHWTKTWNFVLNLIQIDFNFIYYLSMYYFFLSFYISILLSYLLLSSRYRTRASRSLSLSS